MLSSKKQSSFHKRTTFGIFTCCKILLRPETICEMNQKGEENRSQLPLSFLNKKFPEILQRTSFQLGMVVGTVRCLNSGAKKVTCSETCPKGLPLQISFNIQLGKCQESFIRRLEGHDDDFGFDQRSWLQLSMQMVFLWIGVWQTQMSLSCASFPWTNATGDSIQSFRPLQKFRQPRILHSFSSCQCHQM